MEIVCNQNTWERCVFGEDGKSGTEHVTFSSFAYHINKKGVTFFVNKATLGSSGKRNIKEEIENNNGEIIIYQLEECGM
jgi:hypothetical protein